MFKALRLRHPDKYESMGSPSLIMNNTLSNTISFIKFLIKREWQELNDSSITSLGKGMLTFLIIYLLFYHYLLINFLFSIDTAAG